MIALVTGGTGGLGADICRMLGRAGYDVAVGYHTRRDRAEALVAEIAGPDRRALALRLDVSDAASTEESIGRAARGLGGLDALVNAAAWNVDRLAADLTPPELSRLLAVNVAGTIHATQAALPWILSSNRGRIIFFSSVLAHRASSGISGYAATKGAIEALTRALAVELGPKRITVNALAPGYVDAGLGRAPVAAVSDRIRTIVPLRRAGAPEEVAHVVAFLVSEAASYVSGAVIPVDGGLLAGSRLQAEPRPLAVAREAV